MIGSSVVMRELNDRILRVARSDAKLLITGESGVGKELVARAVQSASARANGPFVVVNCGGLPDTLLESDLFGHVKGSFTGAYRDKPGKFEIADGGTLLLDEVGEMSPRMQSMLLRFLETGEIQKVGAERAGVRVDVRVITSTNRSLREMVALGKYREDLMYRLDVINIAVPPLRERPEDIPELVAHFLDRFARDNVYTVRAFSPEAMGALTEYPWPGNVRELANTVERVLVAGRHPVAGVQDLPIEISSGAATILRFPKERPQAVGDDLFKRLIDSKESFWTAVYPLYMRREITRGQMRDLLRKALQESNGSYRHVVRLFNMEATEYKRFLNFLRKHDCQLPFREYR